MQEISVDEVEKNIDAGSDYILIDVRTEGEYTRGKIQGSVNIPLDKIRTTISTIVSDKKKKIILYCLSGSRSIQAAVILEDLAYQKIYNMTNGLLAWRIKGYPLVL